MGLRFTPDSVKGRTLPPVQHNPVRTSSGQIYMWDTALSLSQWIAVTWLLICFYSFPSRSQGVSHSGIKLFARYPLRVDISAASVLKFKWSQIEHGSTRNFLNNDVAESIAIASASLLYREKLLSPANSVPVRLSHAWNWKSANGLPPTIFNRPQRLWRELYWNGIPDQALSWPLLTGDNISTSNVLCDYVAVIFGAESQAVAVKINTALKRNYGRLSALNTLPRQNKGVLDFQESPASKESVQGCRTRNYSGEYQGPAIMRFSLWKMLMHEPLKIGRWFWGIAWICFSAIARFISCFYLLCCFVYGTPQGRNWEVRLCWIGICAAILCAH
jgi:hypothetical protein